MKLFGQSLRVTIIDTFRNGSPGTLNDRVTSSTQKVGPGPAGGAKKSYKTSRGKVSTEKSTEGASV